MKLHGLVLIVVGLLVSCTGATTNGGTGSTGGGYGITVKLINVPAAVVGHKVQIYVEQRTGTSSFVQNAQVNSLASANFEEPLRTYTSSADPGTDIKKYSGDVQLSFSVSVDVNGNGVFYEWGSDVYDHVHYQDIPFSGAGTLVIDYSLLKLAGGT